MIAICNFISSEGVKDLTVRDTSRLNIAHGTLPLRVRSSNKTSRMTLMLKWLSINKRTALKCCSC